MPITATVDANFIDLTGVSTTGYAQFTLISPTNQTTLIVTSTGLVAPRSYKTTTGASFSVSVIGNDQISDSGGNVNTYYSVGCFDVNNNLISSGTYLFQSGSSYNLLTAVPITPAPVFPNPNLVNINTLATSNLTANAFTTQAINTTLYADQFPGATADIQINSAIAALGSNGGVVDCSGYGATTQSIATSIIVPSNVWLRGNLATKFQPAANNGCFIIQPNGRISGFWVDTANLTANTLSASIFTLTGGTYKDGELTLLADLLITATNQLTANGAAILFDTTSGGSGPIAFVSTKRIRINGMGIGIFLRTSGSEWINGCHFEDIEISSAPVGYVLDAGGSIGIGGNLFSNCSFEAGTITINVNANIGIFMEGSGPILYNTFANIDIWDSTTPIENINAAAAGNYFFGRIDGTVSDSTGANNYVNLLTSTMQLNSLSIDGLSIPGIYNSTGTRQTIAHVVVDMTTLSSGTKTITLTGASVFSSSSSYTCVAIDETAANPVKVTQTSGSSITFTGTGTDVIRYICVGN